MSDLYREELMEIYKNPSRKGKLKGAKASAHQTNPMCGDEISIQLKVEKGVIQDAKFDGSACLVSIVSSEILLENLVGKTIEYAKNISKDDLLKMLNLNLTTSRIGCATLVLKALEEALKNYEK